MLHREGGIKTEGKGEGEEGRWMFEMWWRARQQAWREERREGLAWGKIEWRAVRVVVEGGLREETVVIWREGDGVQVGGWLESGSKDE